MGRIQRMTEYFLEKGYKSVSHKLVVITHVL